MVADRILLTSWKTIRKGMKTARVKIDLAIGTATRRIAYKDAEIQPDKILFMTYNNKYMCNPKYIVEEIERRGLPYQLVWAMPNSDKADMLQYPPRLKLVKRSSYEFFDELATAHIWVDNALSCEWSNFVKAEGQVYIDTWHGSMGLKRIGVDDVPSLRWKRAAARVSKYVDYAVSDSEFENMVYRTTHFSDCEILEYGHPRNDALVIRDEQRESELREAIAEKYGFDPTSKLLLYAPTFRDSGDTSPFDIDFDAVIDALEERFGGTWIVLTRMHFHDRAKMMRSRGRYSDRMFNVTSYIDMQELLTVVDAGITDYSSWCCDYVLTGRPCFLYTPDLEEYERTRGFYYPLWETPFPISFNNSQLVEDISKFDEEVYAKRCAVFLKARGSFEDGQAAKRVVDKIVEIVEGRA